MPNNIVLLVTIDKFDLNPILVNINKLKPYGFIGNKTQLVLAKPSDLVIDEPIQIEIFEPLFLENENFKPIEFEPINDTLTHGNVTKIDVHVQSNDVLVHNYQNNIFVEECINIYTLKVYNLKRCVYL